MKGTAPANVVCIVVTYNGLRWADRCLGSLRDSRPVVRTIVVDNGSTDGTCRHVQHQFPEVELVQVGKNLGFGGANNIGLRKALDTGASHVLLLNQDAWLLRKSLEDLVQTAVANPDFGILSPMHLNGAGDGLDEQFSRYVQPARCKHLYSDLVLGRPNDRPYAVRFVNAACWLMTAHCLLTVGGFSPTFYHYGEDDNYVDRLHYHGLKIGVVPSAWVHHDRENRPPSVHVDQKRKRARRLRVDYASPACNLMPRREVRRHRLIAFQNLVSLQRSQMRSHWGQAELIRSSIDDDLIRMRALSRSCGSTFL